MIRLSMKTSFLMLCLSFSILVLNKNCTHSDAPRGNKLIGTRKVAQNNINDIVARLKRDGSRILVIEDAKHHSRVFYSKPLKDAQGHQSVGLFLYDLPINKWTNVLQQHHQSLGDSLLSDNGFKLGNDYLCSDINLEGDSLMIVYSKKADTCDTASTRLFYYDIHTDRLIYLGDNL